MVKQRKAKGEPLIHYWLALDMANRVGIDMWEARRKGEIPNELVQEVVERCRNCDWERDNLCEHWLREQGGSIDEAPPKCINRHVFIDILEKRRTLGAQPETAFDDTDPDTE